MGKYQEATDRILGPSYSVRTFLEQHRDRRAEVLVVTSGGQITQGRIHHLSDCAVVLHQTSRDGGDTLLAIHCIDLTHIAAVSVIFERVNDPNDPNDPVEPTEAADQQQDS